MKPYRRRQAKHQEDIYLLVRDLARDVKNIKMGMNTYAEEFGKLSRDMRNNYPSQSQSRNISGSRFSSSYPPHYRKYPDHNYYKFRPNCHEPYYGNNVQYNKRYSPPQYRYQTPGYYDENRHSYRRSPPHYFKDGRPRSLMGTNYSKDSYNSYKVSYREHQDEEFRSSKDIYRILDNDFYISRDYKLKQLLKDMEKQIEQGKEIAPLFYSLNTHELNKICNALFNYRSSRDVSIYVHKITDMLYSRLKKLEKRDALQQEKEIKTTTSNKTEDTNAAYLQAYDKELELFSYSTLIGIKSDLEKSALKNPLYKKKLDVLVNKMKSIEQEFMQNNFPKMEKLLKKLNYQDSDMNWIVDAENLDANEIEQYIRELLLQQEIPALNLDKDKLFKIYAYSSICNGSQVHQITPADFVLKFREEYKLQKQQEQQEQEELQGNAEKLHNNPNVEPDSEPKPESKKPKPDQTPTPITPEASTTAKDKDIISNEPTPEPEPVPKPVPITPEASQASNTGKKEEEKKEKWGVEFINNYFTKLGILRKEG